MFSILIIRFSFKFINYFINNINYNKNNNILKQIIIFRIIEPNNLEPSAMAQVSGVPKWRTCMTHSQHSPSAMCALGVPSPQAGIPSAKCAHGVPNP